ncbi:MAG TPA: type I-E CRISPR-associated protein Cse2/CasB [Gemmatimonadaceae bacterium]|nr:type I-E CRISPR-associated protein Cse2/CasB [Gemmatimonadaceae bacterium]
MSAPLSAAATTAGTTPRNPDRAVLHYVARRLADPEYATGASASLRRGDPGTVVHQPAFQRLVLGVDERSLGSEDGPRRWATAVQALALLARDWRQGAPHVGQALARAGYPESRLGRLLASRGDGFRDQVLFTARFLRAKGASCDATDLAELALVESRAESRAERLRFRIARHYYQAADASGAH